jgi:anthranilate synthase component 1
MPHLPVPDRFATLAASHGYVPVWRRLLADGLTPVSAFGRLEEGDCACLFESVVGGERIGRYSFLAAGPFLRLEARGRRTTIRRPATDFPRGRSPEAAGGPDPGQQPEPGRQPEIVEHFDCDDPLAELERRMADYRPARVPELPPFTSGAVGFAGYDAVRYAERLPNPPPDDLGLPDVSFALYDRMVVFDHVTKTLDVVVLARIDDSSPQGVSRAREEACRRIDETVTRLSAGGGWPAPDDIDVSDATPDFSGSTMDRDAFLLAVEKGIEYIRAGDIFQVVLSQRFETPFPHPPLELYRTLRVVNPSPFMFYLRTPEVTLVGSSPEILVRVVDGTVTVRPLAGTRPRGRSPEEDRHLAEGLLADPKERAEHVMLIDLGRNDVGRVSAIGSVSLSDVMCIERYSHVMHLTSNVTGSLAADRTAFDALRACLPAGTVSGAPKIRAMEIIDELEPRRRGPYAGAVGYIDFGGAMDTCIALRTIVVTQGRAFVQAGAGVVAESVPANEYEETRNKARGLLVAIDLTRRRLTRHGADGRQDCGP